MTFSRTGWLGLVVAMAVTAAVLVYRRALSPAATLGRLAAAGTVALVLVAAVWAADPVGVGGDLGLQFGFRLGQGLALFASIAALFGGGDFAAAFLPAEQRADVWPEYWALFRSRPWTGVGLSVGWQSSVIGQEPHNLVLELLGETGLVGLAAFGVLLGTILVVGGGMVGGLALVAAFLFSVTQTVLFEPTWWFAAGLFLAGSKGSRDSRAMLGPGSMSL
jgi:O-antigen ligase